MCVERFNGRGHKDCCGWYNNLRGGSELLSLPVWTGTAKVFPTCCLGEREPGGKTVRQEGTTNKKMRRNQTRLIFFTLVNLRRCKLASTAAESAKSVVAATAAENQQNPDDAAAVTHAASKVVATASAAEQQKDDNPAAGRAAAVVTGAASATVCCWQIAHRFAS